MKVLVRISMKFFDSDNLDIVHMTDLLPSNAYILQDIDEDGIILAFDLSEFHCKLDALSPCCRLQKENTDYV